MIGLLIICDNNKTAISLTKNICNKQWLNGGLNAVLMRRQSCVEAYAEDAQAPVSSFGSEKEGSLSKA